MNVFEAVKQSVTTRQAASYYGIRVGRNGMACCPFHNDRTPSMKVDSRYYCFGCGASGDVIDFAASLHGLGKRDAAVRLAEDFSIPYDGAIRTPAAKRTPPKPTPEQRLRQAEQHYFKVLCDYLHLLERWKIESTATGCRLASSFRGSIAKKQLCRISAGYFVVWRNGRKSGADCRTGKGGGAA